jgi:hypothetical protein
VVNGVVAMGRGICNKDNKFENIFIWLRFFPFKAVKSFMNTILNGFRYISTAPDIGKIFINEIIE